MHISKEEAYLSDLLQQKQYDLEKAQKQKMDAIYESIQMKKDTRGIIAVLLVLWLITLVYAIVITAILL